MGVFDRLFPPPKPDEFAAMVMAALKKAGDKRQAVYDSKEFRLKLTDEGNQTVDARLDHLYAEYCSLSRKDRPQSLRRILRGLLSFTNDLPKEIEDVKPDLLPVVRSLSYLEIPRLQAQMVSDKRFEFPCSGIGGQLICCIVYDLPDTMKVVKAEDLKEWGLTEYEAMEIAIRNLGERSFPVECLDNRLYTVVARDGYDTSLVILPDKVRKLKVHGSYVALIPNRNTLLITGSEDEKGLALMAELGGKCLDDPRPVSGIPIKLDGDEWVDWMPEIDHLAHNQFRFLEVKTLGGDYAEQKDVLDALYQKKQIEIFVATYFGVQKNSGECSSYCVWGKDIDSLLPKTREILLLKDQGTEGMRTSWERVQAIVGNLMEPTDLFPTRYRVRSFPTNEQIEAIRHQSF